MRAELISSELKDVRLRPAGELISAGRNAARHWRVGNCPFLTDRGVCSEAQWKRNAAAAGRIMQHAHIGFRSIDRTIDGMRAVYDSCAANDVIVDRFGITLDWSMGYPQEMRASASRGTGIVLRGPEDFARITHAAPAASHFGDFMLGLPGALENTKAALAAGATAIGNLGQYFTFRLPYWNDDVATTEATVTALGLISAQDVDILVHSNLDDGFAGLFSDLTCALGMAILEKYIVEELIGAKISHCFGHHFSEPLERMAFHSALTRISSAPGTMIFGNTVSYQSTLSGNYGSLGSYLLADILALGRTNSGHAINPVPVTENLRIPDIEEIVDAQIFAHRLKDHAPHYDSIIDWQSVEDLAGVLLDGARRFSNTVLAGLEQLDIDLLDPAELMLAIRRTGASRLEALFGPGATWARGRTPIYPVSWARELITKANQWVAIHKSSSAIQRLVVCIGTTDVHEHGKFLVERALAGLDVDVRDVGTSVDPEALVDAAINDRADVIAISTYNGIALSYARTVLEIAKSKGVALPIIIGGRLNEIPSDSNSGLPVDVSNDLAVAGCIVCSTLDDMFEALQRIAAGA